MFTGAILLLIGVAIILGNVQIFDLSWLAQFTWPTILIIISLFFFAGATTRKPDSVGMLVPGGIIFTIGATLLFGQLLGFDLIWPAFIAAPAVGLLLLYLFGNREPGLLVPIGILLTVAGTCFVSQLFDIWGIMWPGFIMAPAVGLFLLYLSGNQSNGLLIPVFILTGISVVFFTVFSLGRFAEMSKYIIGGVLVLGGLATIFKRPNHKGHYHGPNNYDDYSGNP